MAIPNWYLNLSRTQKVFLTLLKQCGVEGDSLAGTFLLLKDDKEEMENWVVWMFYNNPTPMEIDKETIAYALYKNQLDNHSEAQQQA